MGNIVARILVLSVFLFRAFIESYEKEYWKVKENIVK